MSLALLVRIAVPALVALGASAAYLIFRNKRQTEEEHGGSGRGSGRLSSSSFRANGANPRATEGTRVRQRTSGAEAQSLEECSICTEDRVLVELYPCKHRSMCEGCVIKIISRNSRACPFCRRRIQGYRDARGH